LRSQLSKNSNQRGSKRNDFFIPSLRGLTVSKDSDFPSGIYNARVRA
jgi:hypothetical protein